MRNDLHEFSEWLSPQFDQPGAEKVFLSYLNSDPTKGPNEFLKTYEIAKEYFKISDSMEAGFREILFGMGNHEKGIDSKIENMVLEETILQLHGEYDDAPDMVSAYSLFGYLSQGCSACVPLTWSDARDNIIESLGSTKRCYVCLHRQFVDLIDNIFIRDQRSSLDQRFMNIVNNGYSSFQRRTGCVGDADGIHYFSFWKWRDRSGVKRINDILMDIVAVTLFEFCSKNDRRKIKRCPYCQEFYIAEGSGSLSQDQFFDIPS